MIKAKTNLYILIFNKQTLEYDIVSNDNHIFMIPYIDIDNQRSLDNILEKLFEECIDLSSKYATFRLIDAEIIKEQLVLSYFTILPFGTKLKNSSHLLPCKTYEKYSANLQKIIRLI